jgi:phospholipid transport system substrate-binding protein
MLTKSDTRSLALKITNAISASVLIALIAILALTAPARAAGDAIDAVKGLVNPAVQILADKSTPLKDRQTKLRDLANGYFDYTAMSRSALGMHWKDLTDQQKKDFTDTFTSFLQDSYLSRISDYSGQQINFVGQSDAGNGSTEVKTTIDQSGGKAPIQVNYMLRQEGGKWLIYDVTVDNISIAANYRNQFNRVMNNGGFDTLLADLKRKQQGLEDQLGTQHSHD